MSQMVFYSGLIHQGDRNYLVNPFEKLVGEPICLDEKDFVKLTPEAFGRLVNVLDLRYREPMCIVYVSNEIVDSKKIVEEDDLQYVEDLLKISEETKLDAYREKIFRQMNELIANQQMISNYELFHFFKLNSYLNAKGYFITDENREEKYLEIINDGDTETLRVLSEYLDSLDEFSAIDKTYEVYKEYKDKIKSATDFKEIEEAYYEFAGKLS